VIYLQYAINALSLGGLYALIALGIALIFGVMGFINFAYGELIMVGGYVLVYAGTRSVPLTIAAAILAVVIAALAQERIAFRPLRDADPTTLLIAAFAVSFFMQNLANLTVGARAKAVPVPSWVFGTVEAGSLVISKLSLAALVVTPILLVGFWLVLKKTAIGVEMRAAAEDFEAARLLGVRANRVIALAFALSGILAGAAAVLFVAQVGVVSPSIGLAPALVGFIATVIGGLRSLPGAALGAFLLGAATVLLDTFLPPDLRPFRDAFLFTGVIAMLLVRPEGLLGRRGAAL
jgi:branched-chain amino acid transport system permease protein